MAAIEHLDYAETVRPEWVGHAGALGPAYAVIIFDHAIDRLYDAIGIGTAYRRATSFSTFTLETHTVIEDRFAAGETVSVRNHIVGLDGKRLHVAQEMFRPGSDRRAALMEQLSVHVDLAVRRSAPFPPDRLRQIEAAMATSRQRPAPAGLGLAVTLDAAG